VLGGGGGGGGGALWGGGGGGGGLHSPYLTYIKIRHQKMAGKTSALPKHDAYAQTWDITTLQRLHGR